MTKGRGRRACYINQFYIYYMFFGGGGGIREGGAGFGTLLEVVFKSR